ncbi:MAG: threonine dehydratase, partial [Cyclobacteriaceae bacterium]
YTKKTSREQGPALVGIEQKRKGDYELLIQRMKDSGINYLLLNDSPDLFSLLI